MDNNGYFPYQDMIPDIADGLTPIQRTLFNAVKILDDACMLQYVQTIFKEMVQTAYIVGCAIDRKIDIGTPYDKITDTALKSPLSDIYYDAVIGLAAEWRIPYPLIDYRGNFGSLQGDPPASMLYTQIKQSDFAKFAIDSYDGIDDTAVGSALDITLPFRFPNLLINGFVFHGSNEFSAFFAPHNIVDSCDAVLAYLRNPRISIRKLMTYLKGPDFPTGGLIESGTLLEIYKTGYGNIDVFADVCQNESACSIGHLCAAVFERALPNHAGLLVADHRAERSIKEALNIAKVRIARQNFWQRRAWYFEKFEKFVVVVQRL